VDTSLHERLHHELQNTTLWGLLTRFCDDLRLAGVRASTAPVLFWTDVVRAQNVHEVYATTLATGIDAPSVALLDDNPQHHSYRERGLALLGTTPESWEVDRYVIDAALRACMMAPGLRALAQTFPDIALGAFDAPGLRPDERLRAIEQIDLTAARRLLDAGPPGDIPALRQLHDGMAEYLGDRGLPTLDSASYAAAVDALIDGVRASVPGIEIEVDDDRTDAVADMLEESQHEAIELHERPLPVDLLSLSDAGSSPAAFLRRHDQLGAHLLAVWVFADLLARQFRGDGADELRSRDGHVLALQAADRGPEGPRARRAVIEDPSHLAQLADGLEDITVLLLTTQASILDAPAEIRLSGKRNVYVLVDQPILEQLRHTLAQRASIRWHESTLEFPRFRGLLMAEFAQLERMSADAQGAAVFG